MPKKETFTSRFEETRGGRVPQKSKIWGDVVYGWSLIKKWLHSLHTQTDFTTYMKMRIPKWISIFAHFDHVGSVGMPFPAVVMNFHLNPF